MALKISIPTQTQLVSELEDKRQQVKAIPAEERAQSLEYQAFKQVEDLHRKGFYSRYGVSFGQAYARIQHVVINTQQAEIRIVVFATQEARQNNEHPLFDFHIETPPPQSIDKNVVAWAYEQLKQLPELEGAQDV